jgi:hypothetical protein
MKPISITFSIVALATALAPAMANAQTPGSALAQPESSARASELGSALRFRQLGDTAPLLKGRIDVGVQFASAPVETTEWSVTRFGARFGVTDRFDIGAWGGYNSQMSDGMAGVDFKIAVLRQNAGMPVSLSVRPSVSATLGVSDIWAANAGVDLSISRAIGAFAPYAGVAAISSLATEHPLNLDVDRETANQTLGFAGLAYTWRSLTAAVEVERGTKVSYAFRLGTRF